MFNELMKMFQGGGGVSWDTAKQLAVAIASQGESEPNVDPVDRIAFEQLGRVAELQVANATGLTPSSTGGSIEITPVTRTVWAQESLSAYEKLVEPLGTSLTSPMMDADAEADPMLGPLMAMLGPMMTGLTAGSMVGNLATTSLGQYDVPIPRRPSDELLVVVPNIDAFAEEWSLDRDDLRLWVCLHEVTYHTVLGIQHVRRHLESLLVDHASAYRMDPEALTGAFGDVDLTAGPGGMPDLEALMADPELVMGAVQSDMQRALLPHLEAAVAVLTGYVDHVMDKIGSTLIGSYEQVTEAMRRRRVLTSEADRFVERMLGLNLTQDQVDRGTAFIDGVVERAGEAGLARLWEDDLDFPTPAEVDAPGLWLASRRRRKAA